MATKSKGMSVVFVGGWYWAGRINYITAIDNEYVTGLTG